MMHIAVIVSVMFVAAGRALAFPVPPPRTYFYDLIVDTDNNAATGCSTPVHDDAINTTLTGIERIIRAKVTWEAIGALGYGGGTNCTVATEPQVVEIERMECDQGTGTFSHTVFDNGDWNVGLNNGVNGADVVEAYLRYSDLGPTGSTMKLAFRATGPTPVSDVLLTTNGTSSGGPILLALTVGAPTLSAAALFGVAICLVVAGIILVQRKAGRGALAVGVGAVLLAGALTVWAATITMDGAVADWGGIAQVANDTLNDSSNNDDAEDIVAGFVTRDASKIYFRFDLKNLPLACVT